MHGSSAQSVCIICVQQQQSGRAQSRQGEERSVPSELDRSILSHPDRDVIIPDRDVIIDPHAFDG